MAVARLRQWVIDHWVSLAVLLFAVLVVWWLFQPVPDEQLESAEAIDAVAPIAPAANQPDSGWVLYWQNPQDQMPTIVHSRCPSGDETATPLRIQPGQTFALAVADCAPYLGRQVVKVQIEMDEGTVEGFVALFDSFEPLEASTRPDGLPSAGSSLPLMIDYRNYEASFGDAFVYAWFTEASIPRQGEAGLQRQLAELSAFPNAGVTKMLMVSSVARLDQLLREERDALQQSGITVIGYNTERAVGTPEAEMNALGDGSSANPVARAAALAEGAGLNLVWGPIRRTVDTVPDAAIAAMVAGGLDGVALQEQKFIENQSVSARVAAVTQTAERYRRIGGDSFHVSVQIMPSRCPQSGGSRWATCADFVTQLRPLVDAIAIWASGSTDRDALPQLVTSLGVGGGR